MKKYKHVNVYDSYWWSRPALDEDIKVFSVPDMVYKVLKSTEGYNNSLYISGTASKNYISVGATGENDKSGTLSLQVDENDPMQLKGAAAYCFPLLGTRIKNVWLYGTDISFEDSSMLSIAIAKALGVGTRVVGYHGLTIWYGDDKRPLRRRTHSATMDEEAVRNRLQEYTR